MTMTRREGPRTILPGRPGALFAEETARAGFRGAGELAQDLQGVKHSHQRRHPRTNVDLLIELAIAMKDGHHFDRGIARLINLSLGGAFVGNLALPERHLPLAPHWLVLRFREGSFVGLEVTGRLIRFAYRPEGLAIGIEFPSLDEVRKKELGRLL
jgi:hypothetical protein